METRILAIGLIAAVLIASLLVVGAGCQKTGSAEAQAKELDSDLGNLDNMNDNVNDLDISGLNDSELSDLEGLL